jgi:hypothetical protein
MGGECGIRIDLFTRAMTASLIRQIVKRIELVSEGTRRTPTMNVKRIITAWTL